MSGTKGAKPERRQGISILGYSLLSLLARKDRTGYELSRFTKGARSMIFSSSGHSNIYKELAKLKINKYVTFRVVKETRPFDKKIYKLTASGRARLRAWVASSPDLFMSRRELNIRAHALWLLRPSEAISLLDQQISVAEQEIKHLAEHCDYLQKRNDIKFPPSPQHPLFGTYSNILLETESRKMIINWCKWMKRQKKSTKKAAKY